MAKQEKKIRSCRQAWLAYRSAFSMINWLLSQKKCWIDAEDEKVIAAYRHIIAYERKIWAESDTPKRYASAPDWVLYRLAYQDSIQYMNWIRNCSDYMEYLITLREEREVVRSFVTILNYSRVNGLSNADRRKLYQYTRKFNPDTVFARLRKKAEK